MDDPRVTGAETSQESQLTPFGARTFLGGGRVSARLRWFVALCAVALAVMGSLYFYAETLLAQAARQTAEAAAVQRYTLEIEKSVWRLRGTEKDFILSSDPRHIGVYDSIAKSAGNSLGSLESLGASKPIKEHIATVNDGIAQHAAAFQQLVQGQSADADGQTESPAKKLETSARISRLDEIFSYLLPSLNGISEFAGRHGISAREDATRLRRLARTAALAGGGGVILLLLAGGLILMQSLAAPLRDMAESADKLVYGQQDVALPALGNRDEIGEVARALNILKVTLGELSQATDELNRTRGALEAAHRDAQEARAAAQTLETQARDFERRAQEAEEQAEAKLQAQDDIRAQVQAQVQAQMNAQTQAMQRQAREAEAKVKAAETQAKEAQGQARAAQDQMRAAQARATEAQNKAAAAERALAQAKAAEPAPPADQKPAAPAAPDGAPGSSPGYPLSPQPIVSGKNALIVAESAETPIDAIASLSQYLAQSSRNVSDAAFEAERTSALIRGLNDAESHLEKIDPLIRLIGKQTDFLISPPARQQAKRGDTHGNLVALSSDRNAPKDGIGLGDEEIRKRFETIRKAAIQVLQSVRAVAQTVHLSKGSALEIAAASSADALEITTDLLEQSEHLRGMLNDLIGKLHSTSLPAPKETKPAPQAKKPAPTLSAQAVKKPARKPPQK